MSDVFLQTRTQLAQLLGVTVPTIGTAIDDGAPGVRESGGRGKGAKIDAREFIPWWIERERQKVRSELGGKKIHEIEQELDIEIKRAKLLKDIGQLLPRSVLANTMRDVVSRLDVDLRQTPDREAETVIGLKTRQEAVEALQLIVEGLRGALRVSDKWMPPEQPRLELSA